MRSLSLRASCHHLVVARTSSTTYYAVAEGILLPKRRCQGCTPVFAWRRGRVRETRERGREREGDVIGRDASGGVSVGGIYFCCVFFSGFRFPVLVIAGGRRKGEAGSDRVKGLVHWV